MDFVQKFWRLSEWTGKPAAGQKCKLMKFIKNERKVTSYSFLKNLKLGWYSINVQGNLENGKLKPLPIFDGYHKHKLPNGQVVVDHWKGRVGAWEKIIKRIEF